MHYVPQLWPQFCFASEMLNYLCANVNDRRANFAPVLITCKLPRHFTDTHPRRLARFSKNSRIAAWGSPEA